MVKVVKVHGRSHWPMARNNGRYICTLKMDYRSPDDHIVIAVKCYFQHVWFYCHPQLWWWIDLKCLEGTNNLSTRSNGRYYCTLKWTGYIQITIFVHFVLLFSVTLRFDCHANLWIGIAARVHDGNHWSLGKQEQIWPHIK